MAFFDDAMQHFFSILGHKAEEGFGWADVRHEIDYKAEVRPGALVHIECAIIRIGSKAITYHQKLILTDSGAVAAENRATTVLFDTQERHAVAAPSIIKENAAEFTLPPE